MIYLTKYFRHQDTKTRSLIIINIYFLCLSAFVAILSGLSGLGLNEIRANSISWVSPFGIMSRQMLDFRRLGRGTKPNI